MTRATLRTAAGPIVLELDDGEAPKTVENFVKLAREGFYDGLIFHRVIPDFMIQGGCPEGNGRGGPGYTFDNEETQRRFARGAIAMANGRPNTNGSQFFILTAAAAPWLDGMHTIFGLVVDGMDVVDAIEQTPTDEFDKPLEPQTIECVGLEQPATE
jgi:cyclophilin family peptidyl-prolyl cis-trans isomerase